MIDILFFTVFGCDSCFSKQNKRKQNTLVRESIFKYIYICTQISMYIFLCKVYPCETHMCLLPSAPLELYSQEVMSCRVDVGGQSWVFWKNKCSKQWSHFSNLDILLFKSKIQQLYIIPTKRKMEKMLRRKRETKKHVELSVLNSQLKNTHRKWLGNIITLFGNSTYEYITVRKFTVGNR